METYITFGQIHEHEIDGKIIDKDCVVVIHDTYSIKSGMKRACELFDNQWCFAYFEDEFDMSNMKYFPRGFINLDT